MSSKGIMDVCGHLRVYLLYSLFHVNKALTPHLHVKKGLTPLHYSAMSGNNNVCGLLLERGADINATDQVGFIK